ncbi:MAG: glycosyl hydrolase, partial [Candidatus Sigynarchaeota archaeon]
DEPNIPAKRPWTDDAAGGFLEKKGYDLLPRLLSLFEGQSDSDIQARVDYADWWSDRFATAYFGQIQRWCHENGILSGGHLNGEDESLGCLHHGFGHVLRPLRRMDVPGVDVIWRQLWPGKKNHHFPKYASSVAHQKGSPWALSESFAVYGSGLIPAQMKWIVDYQAVRGITLFDLAVYQQSNLDWFAGGERPVFGDSNPLWPAMEHLHGYIARLGYLLSCGQPEIHVVVYYPARDFWAKTPDTRRRAEAHDRVVQRLLDLQCDFDFIDDDLLVDPAISVEPGALVIGPMRYGVICLSPTAWISPAARSALSKCARAGVKVLWVVANDADQDDQCTIPEGATLVNIDQVRDHVPRLVEIQPDSPELHAWLRVCKRQLSTGALYFITNEHMDRIEASIIFHDDGIPLRVDPGSGQIESIPDAERTGKDWEIPVKFHFAGSKVIWFCTDGTVGMQPGLNSDFKPRHPASMQLIGVSTGWKCRILRSHVITKAGIEIHDYSGNNAGGHVSPPGILARSEHVMHPSSIPVPVPLGDWRSKVGDNFSGEVEYSVEFDCTLAIAGAARVLDLGDVKYVARVILNGKDLGTRSWSPYSFPLKNVLQKGKNVLQVRVTNTLANQYHSFSLEKHWSKAQLGPYHPKALKFERDSRPSGLFGPVAIMS